MFRSIRLVSFKLVPVVLAALLAGCAATSEENDSVAGSAVAAPAESDRQVFPYLDAAATAHVVPAFKARNGEAWEPSAVAPAVDHLTGALKTMHWRGGDAAPDPTLDESGATDVARALIEKNMDLLKLVPSDLTSARVSVDRLPASAYRVWFTGHRVQPGYEGIDALREQTNVSVVVGNDGEPKMLVNWCHHLPKLTLSVIPKLGADDPRVIAQLLGREPGHHEPLLRRVPSSPRRLVRWRPATSSPRSSPSTSAHGVDTELGGWARAHAGLPDLGGEAGFSFRFAVDAATGEVLSSE